MLISSISLDELESWLVDKMVAGRSSLGDPLRIVIGMFKNEEARISHWLTHASQIADLIILVNHHSRDRSMEVCSSHTTYLIGSLKVIPAFAVGYYQSDIMNLVGSLVARACPTAWLFPMDMDEYLLYPRRNSVNAIIKSGRYDAISFSWRNACPIDFDGFSFKSSDFVEVSKVSSIFRKVAFRAGLLLNGCTIEQGNHSLSNPSRQIVEAPLIGFYLHLPILSRQVFLDKLHDGIEAYLISGGLYEGQGIHWLNYLIGINEGAFSIRDCALAYGNELIDQQSYGGYLMLLGDL